MNNMTNKFKHKSNCVWLTADCEYSKTHEYCPHKEHACTCKPTNKAAQELGKLGGEATKKKHGSKHFSRMGKLSRRK